MRTWWHKVQLPYHLSDLRWLETPQSQDQWKAEAIDKLRFRFGRYLKVAYVEHDEAAGTHSSVVMGAERHFADKAGAGVGTSRVLYKVKLPGQPILGEGKPENQNHAIIFAHGEYVQTLDMNQDNYLGEALSNMLAMFKGDVRLVGFREHIISGSPVCGQLAASSEFITGTLVYRNLAADGAPPARSGMTWALSNGGVSKASKTLNL